MALLEQLMHLRHIISRQGIESIEPLRDGHRHVWSAIVVHASDLLPKMTKHVRLVEPFEDDYKYNHVNREEQENN